MHQATGLTQLEINEPTWLIKGSSHERIARAAAYVTGKSIEDFNAELDVLLYRGVTPLKSSVVDIESDHRAIVADFEL